MNAKELRDNWNNFGHDIRNLSSESNATILRALDLLAATEGSEDAIAQLTGYTPGPWHCGTFREAGADPQFNGIDIGSDNNLTIGLVCYNRDELTPQECKANARLIAAAPTLHAALVAMRAATEGSTDEIVRELWSSASRPIHLRATAALVAMRAAKEKAEAERDELKRHAEAMADAWYVYADCGDTPTDCDEAAVGMQNAYTAYRAAQEKKP